MFTPAKAIKGQSDQQKQRDKAHNDLFLLQLLKRNI